MKITNELKIIQNIKNAKEKQMSIVVEASNYIREVEKKLTEDLPDSTYDRIIKLKGDEIIHISWQELNGKMRLCKVTKYYVNEESYDGAQLYNYEYKPVMELKMEDRIQAAAAIPTFLMSFSEEVCEKQTSKYEGYHQSIFGNNFATNKIDDSEFVLPF